MMTAIMGPRGLIIGAPRSGGGKTTVALGLMRAFANRGRKVVGAKCGPDYIDPAFHRAATGHDSDNLDSWAMPPALMAELLRRNAESADLVIAESLMGFFDGVDGPKGRTGASADIARACGLPLVLVLDVSGQAQTAAAVAKGFAAYDARLSLAGVILTRVASDRHRKLAAQAVTDAGYAVLGAIPRFSDLVLPERHLGLVQAEETENLDALLEGLAEKIAGHVDLDALWDKAAALNFPLARPLSAFPPPGRTIAIARDAAFSFLYPHLIQEWRAAGAQLRFFSPLADEAPPQDCDFCWLPGGYPELHAERLAAADCFLSGLREFAQTRTVHGECGGYMVLGEELIDAEGRAHKMAGLLGLCASFAQRRLHLGYREARLIADHPFGRANSVYRGHEFHYATVLREEAGAPFVMLTDAAGNPPAPAGLQKGNVSGSFFHLVAQKYSGQQHDFP